jgi:N-acetylglutamate synthase and related acetyltransferases
MKKEVVEMDGDSMEITYLADRPEMISTCASWAYSQWGCQSDGSLERSVARFTAGANRDKLPVTVVAIDHCRPAGMASLWLADYDERPELSPWLASLFVHPFHRNRHIAEALIRRVELEARRFGYTDLFLVTEEAKNLYAKYGWEELEPVRTHYGSASLMKKHLASMR